MRIARALAAGVAAVLVCAGAAQAATPELSTSNRLQDRREVAAGQRSYVGGLPGRALLRQRLAYHRRDGRRVGAAAEARRRRLVRHRRRVGRAGDEVLQRLGLHALRPPRRRRPAAAAHRRRARRQPRRALRAAADQPGGGRQDRHRQGRRALRADGRLPVGLHRRDAQRQRQPPRSRRVHRRAPCSSPTTARSPGAPEHHYAALVAANQDPASGEAAATRRRLPRPAARHRLHGAETTALAAQRVRRRPVRQGHRRRAALPGDRPGGRLEDPLGRGRGLRQGRSPPPRASWPARCRIPRASSRPRSRRATSCRSGRRCRCPATSCCRTRSTGASRTWPTSRRPPRTCRSAGPTRASSSRPPLGTVAHARWFGAGYPRLPVDLRHRRRVHELRGHGARPVRRRQGPPAHAARHLRRPQQPLGHRRARGGLRRLDLVRPRLARRPRPTARRPTTSTATRRSSSRARSPSSGAGPATTASATRCTTSPSATCRSSTSASTSITTAGPRARATSSGRAWAPRSSTTASTTSARSTTSPTWRAPSTTARPSSGPRTSRASSSSSSRARGGTRRPSSTPTRWSTPATSSPSRSTGSARCRWRPSSTWATRRRRASPPTTTGPPRSRHARTRASAATGRGAAGLFHTGCGGGQDGKGDFEIFSLTTSIQAVGEGNFGRLGPDQQQRYTDANAETMFSEPATGDTPDEQPGAMPEIFPSAPNGDPSKGIPPNIDRCWTCRSMVMQAWGNYGTAWSVVHQQLGVRPYLNDATLQVVPQVPAGQPSVAGSNIRLGPRLGGRLRVALGGGLHDEGRRDAHAGARARHRPHAAARVQARGGAARRPARQALRRPRDQPRARADGRREGRGAAHADDHDR